MARRAAVVFAVLLSAATTAFAQPPGMEPPRWSLGLAAISSPEPYKGADNDILVVPAVTFEGERFYFRGILAGYRLWKQGRFEADAILMPRFEGYEADDSPFLAGMEKRRLGVDLGLNLAWEANRIGLRLAPRVDVSGRSDGQELGVEVYSPFRFGPIRVEPAVGAVWQSDDLANYYYGVRPSEARPGRPAYEPGSTVNLTGGVFVFSPITRKLAFQGFVRVNRLGDEIGDSPIVDRETAVTGFVSLSYGF
jgi:outer membrane protein